MVKGQQNRNGIEFGESTVSFIENGVIHGSHGNRNRIHILDLLVFGLNGFPYRFARIRVGNDTKSVFLDGFTMILPVCT